MPSKEEKILQSEIKGVEQEVWGPQPGPQTAAFTHQAQEILFGGARGGGKTYIQLLWLAKWAIETEPGGSRLKYPNYKGAIFRQTATDLRDWHEEARRLYCGKLGAKQGGQPISYRFQGGPIVRSGHLDKGAYVHYIGWENHKMAVDELTLLPPTYNQNTGKPECIDYQNLLSSNRSSPDGNAQAFLTCNPGFIGAGWVKARFIDVFSSGEKIKPGRMFVDPISGRTRVFIPCTLMNNPAGMQKDPGYLRRLLDLPSEAQRRAWIYGDWDAYEGQFFDMFDPTQHVIDAAEGTPVCPPYAYRWLSCDWGYAHACFVHGLCQGLDGRVHIYKELPFEGRIGGFHIGTEIARAFINDLGAQPEQQLSLFLSHDAFAYENDTPRKVDTIMAGIKAVLGEDSCWIVELSADEKEQAKYDPVGATQAMNRRRQQITKEYSISIVRAAKNDTNTWDYAREMMRTLGTEVIGKPDAEIIESLRRHPNAEALVGNYLAAYDKKPEVLPKLRIWSNCKRLIQTIPEMMHDEKDPEKMRKVDGDDAVDSALGHGLGVHRLSQNKPPLSYYVQDQLREAFANRPLDMTAAHFINMKAKDDYDCEFTPDAPMRLGRFAAARQ